MITLFRKHHRWLMIVIAILAIPFIFYFSQTPNFGARTTDLGRIYDRPMTAGGIYPACAHHESRQRPGPESGHRPDDDQRGERGGNVRRVHLEPVGPPPRSGAPRNSPHLKRDHGLRQNACPVSTATPAPSILTKYDEFTKTMLPSLGFNEAQIEEVVSDQLSLTRLKEPARRRRAGPGIRERGKLREGLRKNGGRCRPVAEGGFREGGENFRRRDREVLRDTEGPTEERGKTPGRICRVPAHRGREETNRARNARTPCKESRTAPTTSPRRSWRQTPILETLPPGSKVRSLATGEFTVAAPDRKIDRHPAATQDAFQLTAQAPFSDPIQGPDGFHVLHLLNVTEAHPLSLEEAKPKIAETLKSERLRELVSKKGAEVARKIRERAQDRDAARKSR